MAVAKKGKPKPKLDTCEESCDGSEEGFPYQKSSAIEEETHTHTHTVISRQLVLALACARCTTREKFIVSLITHL